MMKEDLKSYLFHQLTQFLDNLLSLQYCIWNTIKPTKDKYSTYNTAVFQFMKYPEFNVRICEALRMQR